MIIGNSLLFRSSEWQQTIAEAKFLSIAISEGTQCALHVEAVRIFDCEKQIFGYTFELMTALTSFFLIIFFANFLNG